MYDLTVIESIKQSSRKFKVMEVQCSLGQFGMLSEISEIHGENLKELIIDGTNPQGVFSIDYSRVRIRDVITQFNNFPNLKKLKLKLKKLDVKPWSKATHLKLRLEELSLEFYESGDGVDKFLSLFYPNTIRKFSINCYENLENFFSQQKNIKELKISNEYNNLNLFKNIQLEKVTFYFNDKMTDFINCNFIKGFIQQQPFLKDIQYKLLSRFNTPIKFRGDMQGYFDALSQMEHLESLDVWIPRTYINLLDKLTQSKSLKTLKFFNSDLSEEPYLQVMGHFDFRNVECIEIDFGHLDVIALNNMHYNWSNLKHLSIETPELTVTLNLLLNKLKNLQSLRITRIKCHDNINLHYYQSYNMITFYYDGNFYPNLTKLEIHTNFHVTSELLAALPNLEYLHVNTYRGGDTIYSIKILQAISEMRKLKSLKMQFSIKNEIIITEEFDIIKSIYYKLDKLELSLKSAVDIEFNFNLAIGLYSFMNVSLRQSHGKLVLFLTN